MVARSLRIDTLRGIAVFGILWINVWSFVYGAESPRFGVVGTAADLAERAIVFCAAAFAEQKFYPIFAFLFGAGFALQTGRARPPGPARDLVEQRYRRRVHWLLGCGLLHGLLVWYGDILTTYAITAFWLAGRAGRPLRDLVASLHALLYLNVLVQIAMAVLVHMGSASTKGDIHLMLMAGQLAVNTYTEAGWLVAGQARAADFLGNLLFGILFLPRIALFFLVGVFAVRLGWLTRPQRHARLWRRILAWALAIGLPLNLWWGYVMLRESVDPYAQAPFAGLALYLIDLAGPCLAAAYVAALMLARETVVAALAQVFAPVGRMALTNYLTQSVVCVLLLQGVGLGLGAHWGHARMVALCLYIMLAQVAVSRYWMARHAQGPAEWLWRRHAK